LYSVSLIVKIEYFVYNEVYFVEYSRVKVCKKILAKVFKYVYSNSLLHCYLYTYWIHVNYNKFVFIISDKCLY